MRIDGKAIRETTLGKLRKEINTLGVTPHLAIILVGNNPASVTYVRQKEINAEKMGAKSTILKLNPEITQKELLSTIEQLNNDNNIHGIIVQQPLPKQINEREVVEAVDPKKDIDGLHSKSPFPMPLAVAVMEILKQIFIRLESKQGVAEAEGLPTARTRSQRSKTSGALAGGKLLTGPLGWLRTKDIVVLGKGDTGGGPVIERLKKDGIKVEVIDSKTKNPKNLIKKADIIISAVGKINLIKPEMIKKNVILISIGLFKGEDGKMHGDYDEDRIQNIASFYTPVPGGVGPVNVAMLLKNLVKAAKLCIDKE